MKKVKKSSKLHSEDKFSFSLEFQTEILRYFIQSREGVILLPKIKPGYFTLIEHSIILESINRSVKKYKRIPSQPIITEIFDKMVNSRDYIDLLSKEDMVEVKKVIQNLYNNPLKDEDIIKGNIHKFIAYLEVKSLNESTDFTDFDQFEEYQDAFAKIMRASKPLKDNDEPLYMVSGTTARQLMRRIDPEVIPTPYKQLNDLTNGGGYERGSILVLLDKAKAKKTFTLVNISRGYLTMRKNILYIDTENGKNQIMGRMVQSTLNKTKREMMSGDFDKLEKKHMRKYAKLGVEFIVEKVPAKVADANYLKSIIQKVEAEKGIKIHVLMVDYAAKLASIGREKDDFERISNVYIDLANMADELSIEHVWTANHVTRDAMKRKTTRYEESDIALCIDISRHAHLVLGLNSTEEEEANDIQRAEIVVQRDGLPHGRALFNLDVERQRMKEFTREQRAKYDESVGKAVDAMMEDGGTERKAKANNPHADSTKRAKRTGDV